MSAFFLRLDGERREPADGVRLHEDDIERQIPGSIPSANQKQLDGLPGPSHFPGTVKDLKQEPGRGHGTMTPTTVAPVLSFRCLQFGSSPALKHDSLH